MLKIRPAQDRGQAHHGWLRSQHTFSFASYHDAAHMGFGPLRVLNEDRIEGGTGFGAHPHRDMEIISYVMEGALRHQDDMGNQAVIRPGEVQRMTAGTGVVHSEQNADPKREAHFLQIWIVPDKTGLKPGYGQKDFSAALDKGGLVLVVSKDGRDGSISISQDADLYIAKLPAGGQAQLSLRPQRGAWIQVLKGCVGVLGAELRAGDGAAVTSETQLGLQARDAAEFLLFDLPES
jgi:redox-sensitive bicupin YhaK (pirin superfamily)